MVQKNDCPTNTALSQIKNGFYRCIGGNYPWIPPGAGSWGVLDVRHYADWVDAIYKNIYGEIYYINQNTADRDYAKVALAEPPQVYDLPLAAGVERQGNDMCAYWKNQFDEVTAIAAVHFQRTAKDYNPSIGWLPAGFRPSIMIEKPASFSTPEGRVAGTVLVFPDGAIHLIYDHMGETFSCFEVSFVASA